MNQVVLLFGNEVYMVLIAGLPGRQSVESRTPKVVGGIRSVTYKETPQQFEGLSAA